MLNALEFQRYHSHLMLDWFGVQGQLQLKKSSVLCVGAGGIASPLLYYLAAAGVGTLGIIDHDRVSLDNLTRQILFTTQCVGIPKVMAAQSSLMNLNQNVRIETFFYKLQLDNAEELFNQYDMIADCSDNFKTKLLVNDTCYSQKKAFVTASAYQHHGHFAIFDGQAGPCYRCLFETINIHATQSCHETGILSPLLGILGSLQAIEIIKHLSGYPCVYDQLHAVNALNLEQKKFKLLVNPLCTIKHQQKLPQKKQTANIKEITSLESLNGKDFRLIDVCSYAEHEGDHIGGECIPLEELVTRLAFIHPAHDIVLYCKSGKRSRLGCELLQSLGYENVYCLHNHSVTHI